MSPKFAAVRRAPLGVAVVLAAAAVGIVAPSVTAAQNVSILSGLDAGDGPLTLQQVSLENAKPAYCSRLEQDGDYTRAKAEQLKATQNRRLLRDQYQVLADRARNPALMPGERQRIYQQMSTVGFMMRDQDRLFAKTSEVVRAILDAPVIACGSARTIAVN